MAQFYVMKDGFLVSHGFAQDGTEALQAAPGQTVVVGEVPGYDRQTPPHRGAKWSVAQQAWIDTRTEQERQAHAGEALIAKQRANLPPFSEMVEALYAMLLDNPGEITKLLINRAQPGASQISKGE